MTMPHGQTWQAPQARAPLPRALAAGRHAAAQQAAPRHPGHLLQVGTRAVLELTHFDIDTAL